MSGLTFKELELWKKVDPYIEGMKLWEDAPQEAKEALEQLRKIARTR